MYKEKKKKKILFISSRLYPTSTANSINTYNVVEEMLNRGHDITYIAVNQEDSYSKESLKPVEIYNVKSTKYGSLLGLKREEKIKIGSMIKLKVYKICRMIRNLLQISKFPDVDPKQSKQIYCLAKELHAEKDFDCIIGVFRPFSAISATIKMKEQFPDLLCGAYYLDLISGATKPALLAKSRYEKMCYRGELKAFESLDFIIMAKGGESIYSKCTYNSINKKIQYVDFPVFKANNINIEKTENKGEINLVYAGVLDINYRNPEYAFKLLNLASKEIEEMKFNIYGRGNCNSIIKKYKQSESLRVVEHGMVKHEKAYRAMKQSEILINISNSSDNIVPSKIFEMFSTGRPIINFVSSTNDISKEYFDRYPSVCTINEWDNFDESLNRLIKFILAEKHKQYDPLSIKKDFIENTPEFTADIFEKVIEDYTLNN